MSNRPTNQVVPAGERPKPAAIAVAPNGGRRRRAHRDDVCVVCCWTHDRDWQTRQFPQDPAHPEILLHTRGLESHSVFNLLAGQTAIALGELKEGIHVSVSRGNQATDDGCNPRGGVFHVVQQLGLVDNAQLAAQDREDTVVHMSLA